MSKSVKRLFEQFRPENYQLQIEIDCKNMVFSGNVVIKGQKVGRPSQRITFHQNGLKVQSAKITKHDKTGSHDIDVSRINTHNSSHEIRIHSKDMIYPGLYEISLAFSGKITKSMVGLYPSYFTHEGKEKIIFATQFESHHAREVFPCIDEPEAKATFDLTLITPQGQEVLANTDPTKEEKLDSKRTITTFETTPIMSTYLLAFACGELHYVEAKTKSGVRLRSYASVAQPKEKLQFSVDEGVKILEFYEEYFDTSFPLKKLDQLALPDFDSGAMENWGLVTYREIALLTDPQNRSIPSEQYVALVVAHEFSHQWFGNLVTMKWWDDLWLNESFASLAEHICLDKLHPDWQQWETYTSADVISASNRDIYSNVQAVATNVNHPDEITTLFDPAIVYAKGGRLLKMMREYIGEDAFRSALKEYFKTHAYKNTTRNDLWDSMSKASGKDIKALMTPWLEQSGMPIVTIVNNEQTSLRTLIQNRYILDVEDKQSIWPIPLLADQLLRPDILNNREATISYKHDLPLFNQNGSGHFVTHYSNDDDLDEIIKRVTSGKVSSEARINILNDLMLIARRGDDSLVDTLKLVRELSKEPRDAVWTLMARGVGLAANIGEGDDSIEQGIKKFRKELATPKFTKLGWDDHDKDDVNTIGLRANILSFMLGSEDTDFVDAALQRYNHFNDITDIPADRRSLYMSAAVRYGASDVIDLLIKTYQQTNDSDMQHNICAALCYTKSKDVATRLTKEAMGNDGFVRDQDLFRWFAYLMRNKYTRDIAWKWLEESWDRIAEEAGGAKSLEYYIWYAAGPLQTAPWKKKFDTMFESKKKDIALKRNIEVGQAEISARIAWRDRELPLLVDYFKSLQ